MDTYISPDDLRFCERARGLVRTISILPPVVTAPRIVLGNAVADAHGGRCCIHHDSPRRSASVLGAREHLGVEVARQDRRLKDKYIDAQLRLVSGRICFA